MARPQVGEPEALAGRALAEQGIAKILVGLGLAKDKAENRMLAQIADNHRSTYSRER